MRIDLDANVRTVDGEDVGSVQRAVVDPRSNEVTDVVISTGTVFGRDVLVPRAEIERASEDGDALRLRLHKADLERLPDYVPANYVAPPATWMMPAGYGFPAGGYLWPVGYGSSVPLPTEPGAEDERPDEVSLNKGAVVFDRAGEDVGVVDDVRFDAASGRLRGFVLRVGGAFRTLFGGGDTVEVTRGQIERVADSIVYLRVAKEEIERAGR
jgi:sporulation protein YlmC with PRC-barrel domain